MSCAASGSRDKSKDATISSLVCKNEALKNDFTWTAHFFVAMRTQTRGPTD